MRYIVTALLLIASSASLAQEKISPDELAAKFSETCRPKAQLIISYAQLAVQRYNEREFGEADGIIAHIDKRLSLELMNDAENCTDEDVMIYMSFRTELDTFEDNNLCMLRATETQDAYSNAQAYAARAGEMHDEAQKLMVDRVNLQDKKGRRAQGKRDALTQQIDMRNELVGEFLERSNENLTTAYWTVKEILDAEMCIGLPQKSQDALVELEEQLRPMMEELNRLMSSTSE